jgi:hypothetical protein
MNNYTPILDKVITIKNCITPSLLQHLYIDLQNVEGWHFKYGGNTFKDKHAKLEISTIPSLSSIHGIIFTILCSIYDRGGYNYFPLIMNCCGASIKDKHRKDNPHIDHIDDDLKDTKILKILGILNPNWKPEWGGGFIWGNQLYPLSPGDFLIFDPRVVHYAEDIYCDEKRIAIDITVPSL